MEGNVSEWVQDRYGSYPASHVIDPTGPLTPRTQSEDATSSFSLSQLETQLLTKFI
jgi:hypothetical protein